MLFILPPLVITTDTRRSGDILQTTDNRERHTEAPVSRCEPVASCILRAQLRLQQEELEAAIGCIRNYETAAVDLAGYFP